MARTDSRPPRRQPVPAVPVELDLAVAVAPKVRRRLRRRQAPVPDQEARKLPRPWSRIVAVLGWTKQEANKARVEKSAGTIFSRYLELRVRKFSELSADVGLIFLPLADVHNYASDTSLCLAGG